MPSRWGSGREKPPHEQRLPLLPTKYSLLQSYHELPSSIAGCYGLPFSVAKTAAMCVGRCVSYRSQSRYLSSVNDSWIS